MNEACVTACSGISTAPCGVLWTTPSMAVLQVVVGV